MKQMNFEPGKHTEAALKASVAAVHNERTAMIEPEIDGGELELADIIDVPAVQSLLENFQRITGMLGAIVDFRGKVLVSAGWQDICTKFHRCHPETHKNCVESDTVLARATEPGTFQSYRCKNGLWDLSSPIVVSGQHLGNIYFGQFIYTDEELDLERFRNQAQRYGFDEAAYLDALNRVPRYDREIIAEVMSFYSQLGAMISALSFSNLSLSQILTARKAMEYQLYTEKELFKTTLISIGDGVISTDIQGHVLIMNKVSEQLTGWSQAEAVGQPIEAVFQIINEFTRARCDNPVAKVLATKAIIELTNHTLLISKDGIERPIEDSAAPIIDERGNLTGIVLVFRDFTEKKKNQDEIEYLSFHDCLTGLYNRRFYEEELARLDTRRKWPLTIVMGDVNGLKLINDSFGHGPGDQLLIKTAAALKKGCRTDDIIARMGGDEFVILLPETDAGEAAQLIKRIKNILKKESVEDLEISVSFGYETKTSAADDIEAVIKKAEDAMYHNKLFEGPSLKGRVIDNIIAAINSKSKREEVHSRHVSKLCERMGEALGLEEYKIKELKAFGLLHDIGKIAISDKILNKPDKLTEIEWIEMKAHAEIGYRILNTNNDMTEIAEYVLAHHERWDGKGYPKGLKGEEIPLPARICAIADAYDAMISVKSYKSSLTAEVALAELRNNAGTQFDPELVRVFINQ
ncbi:MAG: PocR ligand-binding domain-containing protein, partial [Eubacteriaceae bacterium]|nr:PocR ligand-binding domain-containing protein [Eubacteriaceae bacterium]